MLHSRLKITKKTLKKNTFSVPTIDAAPSFLQTLIATLGKPFVRYSDNKPSKLFFTIIKTILLKSIYASAAYASAYLYNNEISIGTLPPWSALALLLTITLLSYRRAFRRLYDIYTADAAKTGRYAFPALRR